jgi:rhodanese-related sulfurtransferase
MSQLRRTRSQIFYERHQSQSIFRRFKAPAVGFFGQAARPDVAGTFDAMVSGKATPLESRGEDGEKQMRAFAGLLVVLLMASGAAHAFDAAAVPEIKRTKLGMYLSSPEAAKFVDQNPSKALFLDVRTTAEVAFLGMAVQADANVPYMREPDFPVWDNAKATLKLEPNPDFIPEVRRRLAAKRLGPADTIVLICRSGDRSAAAANLLAEAGFKNVYSVVDGFEGDLAKDGPKAGQRAVNGWKNAGLPWSYKLDRTKMYRLED